MNNTLTLKDYRLILEYIKRYTSLEFKRLLHDYNNLCIPKTKDNIILEQLFSEQNTINFLIKNNKQLIDYLKKNNILLPLYMSSFKAFIENLNQVDFQLENIERLNSFPIDEVHLYVKTIPGSCILSSNGEEIHAYNISNEWFYMKEPKIKGIKKLYTDGLITYQEKGIFGIGSLGSPYFLFGGHTNVFGVSFDNYNWVIESNVLNDNKKMILYLNTDFNFNLKNLPNKEEIMSLTSPDSLIQYRKQLILKKQTNI